MIDEMFRAIDARDVEAFTSFLAPECRFRFGNLPEVAGLDGIRQFVSGFFASIAALEHEIAERWEVPGGWVVHGVVSYTRQDGSVLTVPFAILLKTATAGITEYLIFADTSELYR